jgi:hypothetical protein
MTDIDSNTHPDSDDRIDALARTAGSELRRSPSPSHLARVHRVKRQRHLAQAAAGGVAVVALIAGGFALANRDDGEQLVPATAPTTVLDTTPPSVAPVITVAPTPVPSAPAPAPTTAAVPVTTSTATTASATTTIAVDPTGPEVLFLAGQSGATDEQRVIDLRTLDEVGTEPLDDARASEHRRRSEPRLESSTGVRYELASVTDDNPTDGIPIIDECGQQNVLIDGAPPAGVAVPSMASFIEVSSDGRSLLAIFTPDCAASVAANAGADVMRRYEQEIWIFDADDPAAPGRLSFTAPSPEREFYGASFSDDGRWVALEHNLNSPNPDGDELISQLGLDVIELATGRALDIADPNCRIVDYGQFREVFVGSGHYALTKRCSDGLYVELNALDGDLERREWRIPGIGDESYLTVEVWPPSLDGTVTFLAVATTQTEGSSRMFLGQGDEVRELPFTDARASFGPLPELGT